MATPDRDSLADGLVSCRADKRGPTGCSTYEPARSSTCARCFVADRPHVVAKISSPSVAPRGFKSIAASSTGRPITSHMTP